MGIIGVVGRASGFCASVAADGLRRLTAQGHIYICSYMYIYIYAKYMFTATYTGGGGGGGGDGGGSGSGDTGGGGGGSGDYSFNSVSVRQASDRQKVVPASDRRAKINVRRNKW